MSGDSGIHLVAAGHAHPERELTSAELERIVPGLGDGWSEKYLGMRSRRVLGVEGSVNTLLIDAVGDALDEVGWNGSSLDAVVCGTVLTDQVAPAAASYVASAHNPAAIAFDVSAGCAGFLYALEVAARLLRTGDLRRAVVCSGEHATAYADYTDPHSSVFWGDGAGAVLAVSGPPGTAAFEVVDTVLNGDHEFPEKVFIPRGGYFRSDARYSYSQVLELGSRAVLDLYDRNDVDGASVAGLVVHQANRRILEEMGERVGVPFERQWFNFDWAGNQSAAGIVTAFSAGWHRNRDELADGDHVILVAVGGGYAGAATLLRWRTPSGT